MTLSTTTYPYITANKAILEGVPIIEGTRVSVRAIAGYCQCLRCKVLEITSFHISSSN